MAELAPETIDALKRLKDFFEKREIPFVIIGALVPVLLIDPADRESLIFGSRETRDIDYAIRILSWEEYKKVTAELREIGFSPLAGAEHRFLCGGIFIDIIPFSSALTNGTKLIWPDGQKEMNVVCFEELFSNVEEIQIDQGLKLPVAPLPLFVALKIFCYLDRRFPQDLRDIAYVLENYEESSSRRFEIEVDGITFEAAGAYLLGKDLKEYVSSEIAHEILSFLESIDSVYAEPISRIVGEENRFVDRDERSQELFDFFQAFASGLRS